MRRPRIVLSEKQLFVFEFILQCVVEKKKLDTSVKGGMRQQKPGEEPKSMPASNLSKTGREEDGAGRSRSSLQ